MTDDPGRGELAALRQKLDIIDGELLQRAAARMAIVAKIRDVKRRQKIQLFDRAREQQVYRNAEERGAALGLEPGMARALMGVLVESAHAMQERPTAEQAQPNARRLLIVGGRGQMGQLFSRAFQARGHQVEIMDKDDALEPGRVARADMVMVAAPMTLAAQITAQLCQLVRPDALLCDINSLKGEICAELQACVGEALGTHPMFGPTVRSLRRQKIVLCRVKPGPMAAWLEDELGSMGADLILCDAAQHDKMMAVIQVLTHYGIMVMGRALSSSGVTLAETLPFMSPIYRLELSMVGRLFSQDPELYREIVMANPAGGAMYNTFLEQASDLARIIDERDDEAFMERFEQAKSYFAGFAAEAMTLSDDIIETIVNRP